MNRTETTPTALQAIATFLSAVVGRNDGQTLVEYALIIALFSVVLIASLAALSTGIDGLYQTVISQF
jgi:Flp pilus assembly pilin Flp